jgi:hypothetical protein
MLVEVDTEDLAVIADLLDAQRLLVRIGQVLSLGEARQAHEMLEGLRPLPAGKLVLNTLGDSAQRWMALRDQRNGDSAICEKLAEIKRCWGRACLIGPGD